MQSRADIVEARRQLREADRRRADKKLADQVAAIAGRGGVRALSREEYRRTKRDLSPLLRRSSGAMPPPDDDAGPSEEDPR